jgi:hypothetical protein
MKFNVLALALAATLIGSLGATAQTVIEERHDPAVVIEKDRPAADVTIREHVGEKKVIKKETTGAGVDCSSKTVHKEGLGESKTVTKTNCD